MLDFIMQRKKVIMIIVAIILLGGYYFYNSNQDYNTIEEQEILVNETNTTSEENNNDDEDDFIVVHVAGCVKTPGIVKLKDGSRVEDAIEAAGGLTEDADITNINLAYVVDDGTKIKIPSVDDVSDEEEDYITEDSGYDDSSSSSSSLININTASQTELETLNGIGPSLATRIIEYRETNGDFKTIEDIKNVSGIGDTKFDNIKDFIEV